MGRELVLTTWDWQRPQYTSKYWEKTTNPYGRVYSKVIESLNRTGWEVKNIFDHPRFKGKTLSFNAEKELLKTLLRVSRNQPAIVFHDHYSFFHQNCEARELSGKNGVSEEETKELESILQEDLFWHFRGKVEFVYPLNKASWKGALCYKDQFYLVAQSLNIPVPETRIIKNVQDPSVNFSFLNSQLNKSSDGEIMIKLVESSGGDGVYKVGSQDEFSEVGNTIGKKCVVAQRRLPIPNKWPYSIRVLAWQDKVLGAALLVNPNHEYKSNAHQGGSFTFDLAMPGTSPKRCLQSLHGVKQESRDMLFDIANWCSIDLASRVLPEDLFVYTQKFGRYESNALLKGFDFMFDKGKTPLAIEANMHPGPPGTGMYGALNGERGVAEEREVRYAVKSILNAISTGDF